jgi:hypothetical protein
MVFQAPNFGTFQPNFNGLHPKGPGEDGCCPINVTDLPQTPLKCSLGFANYSTSSNLVMKTAYQIKMQKICLYLS